MLNEKITVVLPAFNEKENIGETILSIRAHLPECEILVVDDGSTDGTGEIARQAGTRVCTHPYNIGNGAAVKTGLRNARGDWVVLMDADGQHNPADIAGLLAHRDRYDMVVGARGKDSETRWHRDLANRIFNGLAGYVTRFKVHDLTSGFRLLRRATARQFIYLLPNTFSYPSTITMAYLRSGRSVKYVPIRTRARKGKSKIRLARDGVRFLLIITKIATLFSPFRIFLPVSFVFFLTGVMYYVYTFITTHRFTNMSALLLTTSVVIFMMGLISEQISQMRYERIDRDGEE
ncbi:MAG: glycosyltransferase family 2 protein [Desulfobacterales bacterium]|nr:glycosyltransferase family 2 protein [Desulfobacterales bacterium]